MASRMVEAVHCDKKMLLPVSNYLEFECGVRDTPATAFLQSWKNGVERKVLLNLSGTKEQSFDADVTTLRAAVTSPRM